MSRRGLALLGLALVVVAVAAAAILGLTLREGGSNRDAGALPAGGINTHLTYTGTAYADHERVALGVKMLEAKMVRDSIAPSQPQAYYDQTYRAFREVSRSSGAKFLMLITRADQPVAAQLDAIAPMVDEGRVAAVEGANEWDNVSGSNAGWEVQLRAHQKELHQQVKARWPSMPVVGPSLSHETGHFVGDLSAHLDYGNVHYYATETKGIVLRDLDEDVASARAVSGDKPLWATEANGLMGDGYPRDTPETQAVSMRTLYRLLSERGVKRVFSYEGINQGNPKYAPTHRENNFGSYSVRPDGGLEKKPVFFEVRAANRRG